MSILGPTPRNLNWLVMRDGEAVNQLSYLKSQAVFGEMDPQGIAEIIDYKDASYSLKERARAYLDANCSHFHSPDAWERSARERLDFRMETPLEETGILEESWSIARLMSEGQMPLVLDDEGLALVLEYLENL